MAAAAKDVAVQTQLHAHGFAAMHQHVQKEVPAPKGVEIQAASADMQEGAGSTGALPLANGSIRAAVPATATLAIAAAVAAVANSGTAGGGAAAGAGGAGGAGGAVLLAIRMARPSPAPKWGDAEQTTANGNEKAKWVHRRRQ